MLLEAVSATCSEGWYFAAEELVCFVNPDSPSPPYPPQAPRPRRRVVQPQDRLGRPHRCGSRLAPGSNPSPTPPIRSSTKSPFSLSNNSHFIMESSISVIITSVSNMLPQKYLLEKRAIVDADGCKLLNEDNDLRSVNDSEIPLLHEYNGIVNGGTTLEEERRLMYVAMTRARKKLYILYVLMDSNWQLLQPSRFLKEIPSHLFEIQGENDERTTKEPLLSDEKKPSPIDISSCELTLKESPRCNTKDSEHSPSGSIELADICLRNNFLKRFNVEERSVVSHLFHQWAKKRAFQQPKRLLEKVSFVIDERLRTKAYKHKDVMRTLKPCLTDADAFLYAQYVLRWEQVPLDKRAHLMREKQEHFQKQRIENSMGSSEATAKQESSISVIITSVSNMLPQVNDSEIPLLHEYNGIVNGGTTLEEERRLMYVAMTRARKKLYILYVLMDSNWQLLQPSRFLKEIPSHLFEIQGENDERTTKEPLLSDEKKPSPIDISSCELTLKESPRCNTKDSEHSPSGSIELADICLRNNFLKRFNVEERSVVSHLFHQWAKKTAFQQPKRLLEKVSFVIDERLRTKAYKHKDVMRTLKPCLTDADAFLYAQYVLRWEQVPLDKRAHLMREKQEHFQKQRIENSMGSSEATAKQISYLQSLGCTIKPDSRLHASRLIEQYKSL